MLSPLLALRVLPIAAFTDPGNTTLYGPDPQPGGSSGGPAQAVGEVAPQPCSSGGPAQAGVEVAPSPPGLPSLQALLLSLMCDLHQPDAVRRQAAELAARLLPEHLMPHLVPIVEWAARGRRAAALRAAIFTACASMSLGMQVQAVAGAGGVASSAQAGAGTGGSPWVGYPCGPALRARLWHALLHVLSWQDLQGGGAVGEAAVGHGGAGSAVGARAPSGAAGQAPGARERVVPGAGSCGAPGMRAARPGPGISTGGDEELRKCHLACMDCLALLLLEHLGVGTSSSSLATAGTPPGILAGEGEGELLLPVLLHLLLGGAVAVRQEGPQLAQKAVDVGQEAVADVPAGHINGAGAATATLQLQGRLCLANVIILAAQKLAPGSSMLPDFAGRVLEPLLQALQRCYEGRGQGAGHDVKADTGQPKEPREHLEDATPSTTPSTTSSTTPQNCLNAASHSSRQASRPSSVAAAAAAGLGSSAVRVACLQALFVGAHALGPSLMQLYAEDLLDLATQVLQGGPGAACAGEAAVHQAVAGVRAAGGVIAGGGAGVRAGAGAGAGAGAAGPRLPAHPTSASSSHLPPAPAGGGNTAGTCAVVAAAAGEDEGHVGEEGEGEAEALAACKLLALVLGSTDVVLCCVAKRLPGVQLCLRSFVTSSSTAGGPRHGGGGRGGGGAHGGGGQGGAASEAHKLARTLLSCM